MARLNPNVGEGGRGWENSQTIPPQGTPTPVGGSGRVGSPPPLGGDPAIPPLPAAPRQQSRFRDLAEAELFNERAAVREYLGGVPRAAAERLAWLEVLAARQLAAAVLDHMADELAGPS